jgi:hypothetical protein
MKFLGNGRSLEKAQMMTAHESPQLAGHPSQVALPEIKTATEGRCMRVREPASSMIGRMIRLAWMRWREWCFEKLRVGVAATTTVSERKIVHNGLVE